MSAEQPTVLLIEPKDRSRRLLEHGLRKEGFEVDAFASLEDAEQHGSSAWQVAVVDAGGVVGALEAVGQRIASVARRPLVAIAAAEEVESAEAEGARAVVLRPARIRDLAPLLRSLAAEPDETLPSAAPLEVTSAEFTRDQLVELLDEIVLEERTGAIRVQAEGVIGTLYFREGELIDAVAARAVGQAAVNRLLYVDGGRYEVLYVDELDRERTIEGSPTDVLQDAEEYAEEFRALVERLPSLDTVYAVSLRSVGASSSQLPPETDQVVRQVDGRRTVREVIFSSPVDDFVSLQVLWALWDMGALIEVRDEEDEDEDGLDDGFEQLRLSGSFRAVTGPVPTVEAESAGKDGRSAIVVGSPRGFTGSHRAITGQLPSVAASDATAREASASAERAAAVERAREESQRRNDELAELMRREEELHAARREAEDRAARMAEQEAQIARERMRLSGALPAVPEAPAAADDGRTMGLSSVAVATGAAAATMADTSSKTLAGAPALAGSAEPASDAAGAAGDVEEAFLSSAVEAESDFFTSDHDLAAYDDPFAEPESSGPGPGLWIVGGLILLAIVLVAVFGSDSPEPASGASADAEAAASGEPSEEAEGPTAAEALPEIVEPEAEVAEPSAEELAAAAEAELRSARESTAGEAHLLARDLVASHREVILDLMMEELPPIVEEPAEGARDPEREAERERRREERRQARAEEDTSSSSSSSSSSDRDIERALRECALASSGGNYQQTITRCEDALRADPRNAESLVYLGKAHFELGNSRQAIGYLEQALRISSRNRTALVILGSARQDMGDSDGARQAYERYLELYPDGSRSNEIRRILESL